MNHHLDYVLCLLLVASCSHAGAARTNQPLKAGREQAKGPTLTLPRSGQSVYPYQTEKMYFGGGKSKGIEFAQGSWSELEHWFDIPLFVDFVVEVMDEKILSK